MKTLVQIIATLLILGGLVFFLQGIGILPGSFMSNNPQWAVNGGLMVAVGAGLLLWTNRRL